MPRPTAGQVCSARSSWLIPEMILRPLGRKCIYPIETNLEPGGNGEVARSFNLRPPGCVLSMRYSIPKMVRDQMRRQRSAHVQDLDCRELDEFRIIDMIFLGRREELLQDAAWCLAQRFHIRLATVVAIALAVSVCTSAQTIQPPELQLGRISGTVTDMNGDAVTGATVALTGADPFDRRTVVVGESGFFAFDDVKPGVPYQVIITANGFADWTSPSMTLGVGEFKLLTDIQLRIETQRTTVQVRYNPVEVAAEQFKSEEKQRILGILPNFYVTYDPEAEPLTTKLKFELALKVSTDAVTVAGVALISGAKQAANTPNYGQGAEGYGKRFGATAADGFTDIMIGGAILPSLFRQDPRYFYQGAGTAKSRIRHAMLSPFVSKGDNGKWQPNYSSLGGDLASSAIANIYYPKSNRGAGLVFTNFAIGTAERVGASLAQEFVLSRFTHRGGHVR